MAAHRNDIILTFFSFLTLLLFATDIVFGSVSIPIAQLSDPMYHNIIFSYRLPKALTAVLTGAAISVAGLIMQTHFQNPLAGPYVLGVSSGASLGVALFMLASPILPSFIITSGWGIVVSAIIGALAILLIVLMVSYRTTQPTTLLIIGIMFGQIAGSIVTILQNYADPDSLKLFVIWTFGSLSSVTWTYMQVMLPLTIIGLAIAFSIQKPLNALLLGENYAHSLGINIRIVRILIIITIALLAGATTAFTGPIAFIGIAVPHLVRMMLRTNNHNITIPASILVGASLLLVCDICSQLPANGTILPINAISSIVGAPIIIWIILKNRN
ncbi:MAG: iron ABC transporter permease [Paludibacteraceae bacterium]|nr:iron ABC transporter permease [Paludibacteraceae bacterium]